MSLDIWLWSPNELKSAGLINEKTLALSRLSKENSNHHSIRKFKSSFKRKFKSSHCTGILAKQHCLKEFKIKSLHLRFASLKDYMILLIFPASKFKCFISLYLLFYKDYPGNLESWSFFLRIYLWKVYTFKDKFSKKLSRLNKNKQEQTRLQ